jgi:amidase
MTDRRLPAPSPQDVKRLSGQLGLGISHHDASGFAALLEELTEPLHDPPAPVPPAGRRSSAASDPYNAVLRWCEVGGRGRGALDGLRLSLKDSISVAGVPLSCGSALLEGYVPDCDSFVTRRVLDQGAEIVAITNMDDLAASADGSSSVHGPTLNPYDLARTAGGSSGGAAAGLHLDGIDAAIGTDQGGSVRVPASWCGVVGLKPTRGRIPYAGIVGADRMLDHAGILARDVDMVARVFDAVAEPAEAPTRPPPARGADLRLGLLAESLRPELGVQPDVADAIVAFADALRSAGAAVERATVPMHTATAEVETALSAEGLTALLRGGGNAYGWRSGAWPSLAGAVEEGMRNRAERLSPQVKAVLLIGSWLAELFRGEYYAYARRQCHVVRDVYDDALRDVDALILPTTPTTAQPLAPPGAPGETVLRGWAPMANTAQFNLSGHPAISLPLCTVGGLPLGVMLVTRHGEDARLLAIARLLEDMFGNARYPAPPSASAPRGSGKGFA